MNNLTSKNGLTIAIFVIAFVFTGSYLFTASNFSPLSNKSLSDSTIKASDSLTYTCPMHPEVVSDKSGQCPKCGMDLILKEKEKKDEGTNCKDMQKCKEMGCNMDNCKGNSGGCSSECPMMKSDNHKSNGHKHKSGCKGKYC